MIFNKLLAQSGDGDLEEFTVEQETLLHGNAAKIHKKNPDVKVRVIIYLFDEFLILLEKVRW